MKKVKLTYEEIRVLLLILNEFRNELIEDDRNTDILDDIICKLVSKWSKILKGWLARRPFYHTHVLMCPEKQTYIKLPYRMKGGLMYGKINYNDR